MLWPAKPTVPTAAGTITNINDTFGQVSFAWGESLTAYTPMVGFFTVPVNTRNMRAASNFWCWEATTASDVATATVALRVPQWCPFLDRNTAPARGSDGTSRLAWIRLALLAGGAVPTVADAQGVSILPDNGISAFDPATWNVRDNGGFGIFQRTGTALAEYRYVSYSSAPALVDSINLPSAAGWHVADFIIRAARRGDVATPWLTFIWDNVVQFERRVFGVATLPAPAAIRANAHSWAFCMGNLLSTGSLSVSWQFRCGARMPDGTPVFDV